MNDQRSTIWRNASRAICAAFIVFVLLCVYLWSRQAHFIFFPEAEIRFTPADYGLKFEETWLTVEGEKLYGWWIQGATEKVLLYLHGNGVNIGVNAEHAARFQSLGMSVLLVDYRGYGRSEGAFPSEQSVYADAEAMWKHLVKDRGIEPRNIFIYGHSLGSAIGIELALRHPNAAGLIVESAFTSIRDMAKRDLLFRAVPVSLILTQRFASISKIARLKLPVLFLHGSHDTLVPFSMSQRLYEAANEPKRVVLLAGGDHIDSAAAAPRQFMEAIRDFASLTRTDESSDTEWNARTFPQTNLAK
jgi:pimeloyl-ACP methyl ester carboxylesterase